MKGAPAVAAALAVAALTVLSMPVLAATGPARVVTRDGATPPAQQRVYLGYADQFITVRPVLVPEVVVPRAVYATPTHPYLIELTYGNATTVYLDPEVDYVNRDIGPGRIDDNHSILRAQRTWRALHSPAARVIGPLRPRTEPGVGEESRDVVPRPIFRIPIPIPEPRPQAPAPTPVASTR